MTKTLSVAETKARLCKVIHEVEAHGGPIVIQRRGRPVAVIKRFTGQATGKNLWFTRLFGQLAEVADFDRIMKDVVRSRSENRRDLSRQG